jgi:invasion protein IalB
MSIRNIIAVLSTVFIAGVIALMATIYSAVWDNVGAQTPMPAPKPPAPQRPVAPPSQAAPPAAPSAAAAPSAPVRTETITYDAWTVSCRDTADGKSKKICSATLPMVAQQQNQRITIGAWIIAHNSDGALVSVVQTPEIDIGVLVGRGIELKLGNGQPRKINYVDCNPQRCESTFPMDEAFLRETIAAANGPAAITFWKSDGAEFNITLQSIKGVDRAIAAVR